MNQVWFADFGALQYEKALFGGDVVFKGYPDESASDYFNGAITAEDAARIIQSRVSILVSERSY